MDNFFVTMNSCPSCNRPFIERCWECGYSESWEDAVVIDRTKLTGFSSDYYTLPEGCTELQDLIEYKDMNFARGNCFKALYRMGNKTGVDQVYDWEKIIWFANREINRLKGMA